MQLSLLRQQRFVPLPCAGGHYLAAVQNKSGELNALRHASDETWERMAPLVHFVGPKSRDGQLTELRVTRWVKRVAEAVGSRPGFIDLLRLRATQRIATSHGSEAVLSLIYRACRKRGMRFVGVFPLDSTEEHFQIVREAAMQDGRGVCLRYRYRESVLPFGVSLAGVLDQTLAALDVPIEEADLIVDLGFLEPDISQSADQVCATINSAAGLGDWRSIALLGTSIPATMGCIHEGSIGRIIRQEWRLWQELRAKAPLRVPSFGDYAVQHPKPPRDRGGPGMRANVRYTADTATVVSRGFGPIGEEGREQYRELCAGIVALPDFAGDAYSWGDDLITQCACGDAEPGTQTTWRGAGTSHHLRFVTDQLRSMGL